MKKGFRFAALLLACALLTACASSGNGGGGAATNGGEGAKPKQVNIGTQQLPNDEMIAIVKGYFEEEMGVPVNVMSFEAGDIRNAMMAGEIDFAMLGSSSAILGRANGMDVSLIWIHEVIGVSEQLVAYEATEINSMDDLRGKKVAAAFTSTAHYSLLNALKLYGIDEKEITLLDMQQPDIIAAWERGDLDAAYVWEPGVSALLQKGRTIVTSEELASEGVLTTNVEMVRNEFAAQYPDMVTAYIRAVNRAGAEFREDPEACAALLGEYMHISAEEALMQMRGSIWLSAEDQILPAYLGTTEQIGDYAESVIDTAEFLYEQQSLKQKPDHDYMRAFIDPQFVEALLKEE
ncbi:MAG: ABC transporter substrate-binding protein [Lachnospiraceae bacterium]|nr:ABC transporter substrate-binding protein [Lachnospiraceae bacterium]